MKVEFDCFLPRMEVVKKKNGGEFKKGFVSGLNGYCFTLIDNQSLSDNIPVRSPVTIVGSASRKAYKDKYYDTVFVESITPYGV